MNVQIGNYRIVKRNSLNLEIEKFVTPEFSRNPKLAEAQKEKGLEPTWQAGYGFYGTLDQACMKILNMEIHESDAQNVEEMLVAIGEAKAAIIEAVKTIDCPELFLAQTPSEDESGEEE